MRRLALVFALALAPRVALAGDLGPRNAVSIEPLGLLGTTLALDYERFAFPPRWSLLARAAVRSGAGGDYDSVTTGLGVEARYWLAGVAPFDHLADRAMVGPYLGFSLDAAWTSLGGPQGHIGSVVEVSESLWFGFRFTFFRRVELTPRLGTALRQQLDPSGRLPSYGRWAVLSLGLSVGWLF